MTKGVEVVWDPRKQDYIAVSSVKARGRKPFLREANPRLFRGNETPRLAESRAAFAEMSSSAFDKRRGPGGQFPQWTAIRDGYPEYVRSFASPRSSSAERRQQYLGKLLTRQVGEEETRLFKEAATNASIAVRPSQSDLSLVRNRLVPESIVPRPPAPLIQARRVGLPPLPI
ncbi:MAG: hypothetical protein ACREB9_07985 [Thermoplasmata archaeon]